jgi:hypothetical protein
VYVPVIVPDTIGLGKVAAVSVSDPVETPLNAGALIAGAVSVLFVSVSVPVNVASVNPLTIGRVTLTVAPRTRVRLYAPVVVRFPARERLPAVVVRAVPPAFTTIALFPNPLITGSLLKAAERDAYSARMTADSPCDPVSGDPETL